MSLISLLLVSLFINYTINIITDSVRKQMCFGYKGKNETKTI